MSEESQKWETGYKVLRLRRKLKTLTSYCDLGVPTPDYGVGKPTKPLNNCGPCGVFDNLKDAIYFAGIGSRIFECKFIRSAETKFWFYNPEKKEKVFIRGVPDGTSFADEIVLIRCISKSEKYQVREAFYANKEGE